MIAGGLRDLCLVCLQERLKLKDRVQQLERENAFLTEENQLLRRQFEGRKRVSFGRVPFATGGIALLLETEMEAG